MMILRSCTMRDLSLLENWDRDGDMWPGNKRSYLRERINNKNYRMYIGEHIGIPVTWGQIKIEREAYILSWFTAPKFRNEGFGFKMAYLLSLMAGHPQRARINTNRPYSERLAIRLGMVTEGMLLKSGEKWWIK